MNRMYILVNKDLKMSKGKIAAQVAHASARCAYANGYADTVVVLEATAEQMKNLERYLDFYGIDSSLYIDEGVNEVPPFSVTALAVQPIEDDDEAARDIFQGFDLLGDRRWLS